MFDSDTEKWKTQFKLVCRKCGSDNCVIDFDSGTVYSEHSADGPSITFGCNDCKQNDLVLYP